MSCAYSRWSKLTDSLNRSTRGATDAVTFLGTHYRIALSGAAEDTLFCLHQGLTAPRKGETVRLSIAPQSILTLEPEKAAA